MKIMLSQHDLALDKILHVFMTKNFNKLSVEGKFLNIMETTSRHSSFYCTS